MDHDSMLHYTGTHYSPVEPVRFHGGTGFSSSAEEDLSSNSSHENLLRRPQMPPNASGNFTIDEEDDSFEAGFPSTEDFSNNSSYAGGPRASGLANQKRQNTKKISVESKSIDRKAAKPRLGSVRYHECMKNHAASLGGHAVDGCGEFLACGTDGFDALICSVCGCHRNFHRREAEGDHICVCNKHQNVSAKASFNGASGPPTPGLLSIPTSRAVVLHARANLPASPRGYLDDADFLSDTAPRKRRHRTKFSSEQKDRMFSFAEHLEWRILKENDALIQQFCKEIGVKRSVFKVWMHNNKNNSTKRMNLGESEMVRNYDSPSDH